VSGAEATQVRQGIRFTRLSFKLKGSSLLLWGAATLIVAALLLPIVYLIIRAVGTGEDAWQALLRLRTLETLWRTAILAIAVTAASIFLAVLLAWLTVRTDLPLRRLWAVLTPLPLVIPSYVGAYLMASALGPRGLIQQLLEGPFGVTRLPDIYGFPGATKYTDLSLKRTARSLCGRNQARASWKNGTYTLRGAPIAVPSGLCRDRKYSLSNSLKTISSSTSFEPVRLMTPTENTSAPGARPASFTCAIPR